MQSVQVNVVAATFVGGAYIGEGSPKLAVIGIVSKILSVHAKCYLSVTYRSGCIPMARSSGASAIFCPPVYIHKHHKLKLPS